MTMTDDALTKLALRRAAGRLGAVRWIDLSPGGFATYCVGSASHGPEVGYRVTVDRDGVLRCTCPSELRPACWHRASVWILRQQRVAWGLSPDGPGAAEEARREAARTRLEEIEAEFA